jgi:hypothetical protein
MRKTILILSFLFLNTFAFSQRFVSAPYFRTIDYFDKEDSTKSYAIVYRPNEPAKKMLILLPGFGESPQLAEIETDIPKVAVTQGILTVILTNNEGNLSFQIDQNAQKYLDTIIPILLNKYNIPKDEYYLGGFSLGGSAVVKYVQHCNVYDISPKPKAVFAIDPPLDFYRLYNVYDRWLNDTAVYYNNKQMYITMLEKMRTYFRGDLSNAYQNYLKLSPYSYEDKDKIGVRLFENIPITIYCEPDFNWAINEKHWTAYDLNVVDNVSFINELKRNGNKQAQIILTKDKGIRKILKFKHPHSWSIADPNETVKWLLKY